MTNPNHPTMADYAPSYVQSRELDLPANCPVQLTAAIEWLQKVQALIPEDCRSSAHLEVDDDAIYVMYRRPLTDEEMEKRQQNQRAAEASERALLDRLIAKYGVPSGS